MTTRFARIGRRTQWVVGKHLWPLRVSRLRYLARRLTNRWQLVHRADSSLTGPITVWDLGRERRLVFGDHVDSVTQSAVFTRGGWSDLRREYWGQALQPPVRLPRRPRILFVGLGGGTIVRLVYQSLQPSNVTVVELDPVVIEVAMAHMGLRDLPGLHPLVGDARELGRQLADHEPYDLVIEDVFFSGVGGGPDDEAVYLDQLAALVTTDGALVLNRWFAEWSGEPVDSGQAQTIALLEERFHAVRSRRITQRWLNELIVATGKRVAVRPG
jgi:spermidine synthase